MRTATSLLDKKTAMRLLEHGVFLSNKTPPITNHQALLLLAEAVMDDCVREFKGIVKELLAGCCLDDLKATPQEMRAWFGEEPKAVRQSEGRTDDCLSGEDGTDSDRSTSREEAMKVLEDWLDRDASTPAEVFQALHTLWEEAPPNETANEREFDDEGRCLKCGSRVSFADATDTVVFVGEEIVKRYAGDITNRNCVRCTYPKQYPEFEHYDDETDGGGNIGPCDGEKGDFSPSS